MIYDVGRGTAVAANAKISGGPDDGRLIRGDTPLIEASDGTVYRWIGTDNRDGLRVYSLIKVGDLPDIAHRRA